MKSSLHLATTSLVLTLVLQVGEVVIYTQSWFLTTAQNCLEFFYRFRDFSYIYIGYRTPKEFLLYLLLSTKFWWETKGTPDGEKLISSVSRVRHAADGKI